MDQTFKSFTHKFVAILNKKIPVPNLMNALGHMAAGLSASYPNIPEMRFDSYFDRDGGNHKSISDNPFIILEADNSNKIRTLRNSLIEKGVHFVDFTSLQQFSGDSVLYQIYLEIFPRFFLLL